MRATLTIAGMLNWYPKLFDNLSLPDDVDHNTAVFHIVEECGFLEVMFPNPEYLADSIGYWSRGMLTGWRRFWNAVHLEYEPLENYDRHESGSNSFSSTSDGTIDTTTTGKRTGFNSDAFQNTDQSVIDNESSNENSGESEFETRIHGNIGVTTSQQMLESELKVSRELNFYKSLARDFKDHFCVLIY